MKKVEAIFRPERLPAVAGALEASGFVGFTISDVRGHGQSPEAVGEYRGQTYELHVTHKLSLEMFVEDAEVDQVVACMIQGAYTGNVGDGLVTVTDLAAVYNIRNGIPAPAPAAPTPSP